MRVIETALPGVVLVEPALFADARGSFQEAWHAGRYAAAGIGAAFVQDNLSRSGPGVLRGLHFQHPNGQGKLVSVLEGEVFDVAVDVRRGSPAFGRWVGMALSAANRLQAYIPPGFAHGYCVTGRGCLLAYKCTASYDPAAERTLAWDDPGLAIDWPVRGTPILSAKDAAGRRLDAFDAAELPAFAG